MRKRKAPFLLVTTVAGAGGWCAALYCLTLSVPGDRDGVQMLSGGGKNVLSSLDYLGFEWFSLF